MDSPKQVIGLKIVVLLTAVFVAGFSSSKCAAQTRTWTDVSETYKIEAELKDVVESDEGLKAELLMLSLIHISEPTRQAEISYAVFCLKKKK